MALLETRPLMSKAEVAELFGLSPKTVQGWVESGLLAPADRVYVGARAGVYRFDPAEVEAFRRGRDESIRHTEAERLARWALEAERREQRRLAREAREAARVPWSVRHRDQLEPDGVVRVEGRKERFPVEPLFAKFPGDPLLRLSRTARVDSAQFHRAVREGLTWSHADRWAVALGFHPAEVWGRAWWALDGEGNDPLASEVTVA